MASQLVPRLLLLSLLLLTGAAAPRHGEVVLLSGAGEACPVEHLGPSALVLLFDGAALPELLAGTTTLAVPTEEQALTREQLQLVRAARALHLVGGSGLGWWQAMTLRGKRSPLQRALHGAHARGAALVGWGAGAECLAWACLAPSADLDEAGFHERNPRRASEPWRVVGGLGLAPGGLLMDGDGPDALARALGALHRQRVETCLLLHGELAWRWDPNARRVSLHGPGRAVLIELDGARRHKSGFDHAALSVLRAGDRWELEKDRLYPAGKTSVRAEGTAQAELDLTALLAALKTTPPARLLRLASQAGATLELETVLRGDAGTVLRAQARTRGFPRSTRD